MDWRDLVPWLLFLHVLAAIVAIGPNFAYSTIRGLGQQEPQHANFGTRVAEAISARLVYPIGLVIPCDGHRHDRDPGHRSDKPGILVARSGDRGLCGRLPLFVLLQRPVIERIIELTSSPPPPGARGPPAELLALATRARRGGSAMLVVLVVIVLLMVVKPQL